jgi:phosphohistidine swiveling domain-containing protein
VEGKIKVVGNLKDLDKKIAVISRFDENMKKFLKRSKGIIFQSMKGSISSKKAIFFCKKYKIPLIVDAENATTLLTDKQEVVLDTKLSLVYSTKNKI